MPAGSAEFLKCWISTGYDSQTIAGYGTSVEFLKQALTTGQIPWNAPQPDRILLPYQEKILAEGGYLYYAYPFVNGLKLYKPTLVKKLRESSKNLTVSSIHRQLASYAIDSAIGHYFETLTGMKGSQAQDVVALTYLLFPDLAGKYKNDRRLENCLTTFSDNIDWQTPPNLGLEHSTISLASLKAILTKCLSRRGAIVYYNRELLHATILPAVEQPSEIIIHSQKPLTLEVISGIKLLSEADQQAAAEQI